MGRPDKSAKFIHDKDQEVGIFDWQLYSQAGRVSVVASAMKSLFFNGSLIIRLCKFNERKIYCSSRIPDYRRLVDYYSNYEDCGLRHSICLPINNSQLPIRFCGMCPVSFLRPHIDSLGSKRVNEMIESLELARGKKTCRLEESNRSRQIHIFDESGRGNNWQQKFIHPYKNLIEYVDELNMLYSGLTGGPSNGEEKMKIIEKERVCIKLLGYPVIDFSGYIYDGFDGQYKNKVLDWKKSKALWRACPARRIVCSTAIKELNIKNQSCAICWLYHNRNSGEAQELTQMLRSVFDSEEKVTFEIGRGRNINHEVKINDPVVLFVVDNNTGISDHLPGFSPRKIDIKAIRERLDISGFIAEKAGESPKVDNLPGYLKPADSRRIIAQSKGDASADIPISPSGQKVQKTKKRSPGKHSRQPCHFLVFPDTDQENEELGKTAPSKAESIAEKRCREKRQMVELRKRVKSKGNKEIFIKLFNPPDASRQDTNGSSGQIGPETNMAIDDYESGRRKPAEADEKAQDYLPVSIEQIFEADIPGEVMAILEKNPANLASYLFRKAGQDAEITGNGHSFTHWHRLIINGIPVDCGWSHEEAEKLAEIYNRVASGTAEIRSERISRGVLASAFFEAVSVLSRYIQQLKAARS